MVRGRVDARGIVQIAKPVLALTTRRTSAAAFLHLLTSLRIQLRQKNNATFANDFHPNECMLPCSAHPGVPPSFRNLHSASTVRASLPPHEAPAFRQRSCTQHKSSVAQQACEATVSAHRSSSCLFPKCASSRKIVLHLDSIALSWTSSCSACGCLMSCLSSAAISLAWRWAT